MSSALIKTSFSDDTLFELFKAIIRRGGRVFIEGLLNRCYDSESLADPEGKSLGHPYKYVRKLIIYNDYDISICKIMFRNNSVEYADIQLRRPSHFPSPLINRNRKLTNKIKTLLQNLYQEPGIQMENDDGGSQNHFSVTSEKFLWRQELPFEDWESECSLYDEPYSTGQVDDEMETSRNDFIILRFRRK